MASAKSGSGNGPAASSRSRTTVMAAPPGRRSALPFYRPRTRASGPGSAPVAGELPRRPPRRRAAPLLAAGDLLDGLARPAEAGEGGELLRPLLDPGGVLQDVQLRLPQRLDLALLAFPE